MELIFLKTNECVYNYVLIVVITEKILIISDGVKPTAFVSLWGEGWTSSLPYFRDFVGICFNLVRTWRRL